MSNAGILVPLIIGHGVGIPYRMGHAFLANNNQLFAGLLTIKNYPMAERIKKLADSSRVQILSTNYIGHLAFIAGEMPYIIPVTYYFDPEKNRIISYSSEGHKIKAMRKNKQVALCVDEIDSVSQWRSILVHGEFEEVSGVDAKFTLHQFSEGVKKVIEKKEKKHLKFISEFSSKLQSEGIPIVYQIKIIETTGKIRES